MATIVRRPAVKSRALATALVASETELNTAISSTLALIKAANARLARRTSSIHPSQSIPWRFHDSRYRSAAARVASVCGACEQWFIGTCVASRGMRARHALRSYPGCICRCSSAGARRRYLSGGATRRFVACSNA